MTTNVTSTCYTSVLTIPAVQALNGATVGCYNGLTGAVVGSDTVKIMSELHMIDMHRPISDHGPIDIIPSVTMVP